MTTPAPHRPPPTTGPAGERPGSAISPTSAPNPASGGRHGFHWVPIRTLAPRHRDRIAAHLLTLDARDRYLRFGHVATDEQVRRYVAGLKFERDELFGIFNRRLVLIAMAHLACASTPPPPPALATAEFGVSVLPQARGRGYGGRLFHRAVLHARNRGCGRLFIHALSENAAMLKIASHAGATVVRDGSESEAWLKLPPNDFASRMDEIMEIHAAEFNYRLKVHAQRVNGWLDALKDVGDNIAATGQNASE